MELAEQRGYDLEASFAYSDSVTDVPMLEVVGHAHAVNPDKELRKAAAASGWPILVFTKPVALRSRVPLPAKPTLAALAVGGVVAVGGVIWANARRSASAPDQWGRADTAGEEAAQRLTSRSCHRDDGARAGRTGRRTGRPRP